MHGPRPGQDTRHRTRSPVAPRRRVRPFALGIAALAGSLALSGCSVLDQSGGAGGAQTLPAPPKAAEGGTTVVLANIAYTPDPLTVRAGQAVTWRWEDNGLVHTVTADDGSFDSGRRTHGDYSHAFTTPGDHPYHCEVHARMKGTILVTGS